MYPTGSAATAVSAETFESAPVENSDLAVGRTVDDAPRR